MGVSVGSGARRGQRRRRGERAAAAATGAVHGGGGALLCGGTRGGRGARAVREERRVRELGLLRRRVPDARRDALPERALPNEKQENVAGILYT